MKMSPCFCQIKGAFITNLNNPVLMLKNMRKQTVFCN